MKNPIPVTALLLAAAATSTSAQEAAPNTRIEPFVRADLVYAKAPLDFPAVNFKDDYTFGGGFTVGALIKGHHEVSLSVSGNQWEIEPVVTPGVVRAEFSYTQVPILLNYRYHVEVATGLTVFAGVSAGVSWEESEERAVQLGAMPPQFIGTRSEDYISFTYGGSLGVSYAIARGWSVAATASYTRVSGTPHVNYPGMTSGPAMSREAAPSFSLSIGHSW